MRAEAAGQLAGGRLDLPGERGRAAGVYRAHRRRAGRPGRPPVGQVQRRGEASRVRGAGRHRHRGRGRECLPGLDVVGHPEVNGRAWRLGHRVLARVVARAVVLRDPQRGRVTAVVGERDLAQPAGRAIEIPHRDRDAVRTVGIQDAVRHREAVLRSLVVDVVADLPAVHEQQRPVLAGRVVADRQPERGVLPLRQVQGDIGAVPGHTRPGVGRRQGGRVQLPSG